MKKGRLAPGDIVITTRGTLGNIAHYCNVDMPAESTRINSGMAIIRGINERSIERGKFIYASLGADFVQQQIADASFGTAQNQLTPGIINKLAFPLFSSDGQKSFVRLCESSKKSLELITKSIEKNLLLKQGLSSDLLSGSKRVSI